MVAVFVIYCYVANTPQLSDLHSTWITSQPGLVGSLARGPSQSCRHFDGNGQNALPSSLARLRMSWCASWAVGWMLHFLKGCSREGSLTPLGRGSLHSTAPNKAAFVPRASQRLRKMKAQCLVTSSISSALCLFKASLQVPPTLRGCTRAWKPGGGVIGGHLRITRRNHTMDGHFRNHFAWDNNTFAETASEAVALVQSVPHCWSVRTEKTSFPTQICVQLALLSSTLYGMF